MTPSNRRGWLRFFAFFLLPVLVILLANVCLLRTDAHTYYTFYELSERSDIELALVGSSIVFADFNPQLITEKTGLETFSVTVGHMSLPGALAATRLMYLTNQPKYVALVLESDNFSGKAEDIQTQMRLSPFLLTHPLISLRYYLDLCEQDGRYLDRILLFKSLFAQNVDDVVHSLRLRFDTEAYFPESGLLGGAMEYQGRGFLRYMKDGDGDAALRFTPLRPQLADADPGLRSFSKRKLLEYRDLCAANGSELLVIISPNITAQGLGRAGFLEKNTALSEFCREQNIPCYDMSLAKPSFIPLLDPYFYDWYHLDGRGADLFSGKFAEFFNLYTAGEPVDHLFYSSMDEYLDSIDFVTNAWVDRTSDGAQDVFAADCLRGRTVTPEYAFYLTDGANPTDLLQSYSPKSEYRCEAGLLSGRELRVYVRPVGSDEAFPRIFYDLSIP